MAVKLPFIKEVKLQGYEPMFDIEEVVIKADTHLTVLLGGNGLGKTTILQSVIYGLAAGLDNADIEPLTNYRWSQAFFKKRVSNRANAFIVITFELGDVDIIVERSLNKSNVNKLTVIRGQVREEYGVSEANTEYERIICEEGNFSTIQDFRFLVHRLLYLAENRRDITWDLDAQVRILMLLNNDVIDEKDFRSRRAMLKELDSSKRHLKVKINKLIEEFNDRSLSVEKEDDVNDGESDDEVLITDSIEFWNDEEITKMTTILKGLIRRKNEYEKAINDYSGQQEVLRKIIYELSERQRTFEAELISYSLQHSTTSSQLYLRKLIDYGLCPSCGTKSAEFQKLAIDRVKEGKCAICGMEHASNVSLQAIEEVHSQLEEKIKAKLAIDNEISNLKFHYQTIQSEISQIETQLELTKYNNRTHPTAQIVTVNPNNLSKKELEKEIERLTGEHSNLELVIEKESVNLDNEYKRYIESSEKNIKRLGQLFSNFAYEFLGSKVSLEERKGNDRFLGITLFNPVFNDVVREVPEDCSEAQRFFLDIAMRLAMLHLIYELTGCKNSFICETPESALDVSYIDNAARMFRKFIQNGHSLIASTNLQRLGLAHKLVEYRNDFPVSANIFDLLNIGRLSDVQKNSKELKSIRDEILEAANYDNKGVD